MAGFSLVEMMIVIVVLSLVSTGVIGYYLSLKRVSASQELSAALEDNLRVGLENLVVSIRGARYGVPSSNLSAWVSWVSGFNSNPKIIDGGAGPDKVTIARCTAQPVAVLSADANIGPPPPTLTLSDLNAPIDDIPNDITDDFNTTSRRLIYIGDSESAWITAVDSATQVTIDTNPTIPGNQPLARNYKTGTPICRVDVVTFMVDTTTKRLIRNDHQGNITPVADHITDLQITPLSGGTKPAYQITLTAQSGRPDPATGSLVTRSLTTAVSLRN